MQKSLLKSLPRYFVKILSDEGSGKPREISELQTYLTDWALKRITNVFIDTCTLWLRQIQPYTIEQLFYIAIVLMVKYS